ncbi:YMGG-like glycine zipper-containing protein [uncultured Propionivibrio sp.]|uniref:YMGG-like glycine zipper-containing protein n=1 Tax=uncultured Propionivibrio sp. TaxID=426737 RepID=UPI0029C07F21|nr:YMGG-like glycine zipper-containing protein [uncultured Propionivibrio sp.]
MKAKWVGVIGLAVLAGGCATIPSGPSVLVLPGTGKSLNDFRASDFQCRQYAAQQIEGMGRDPSVRNAAIGTAVGAVAGAAIGGQQGAGIGAGAGLLVGSASGAEAGRSYGYDAQTRYDNAYIQCMYAGGHRVPVPASMARSLMEQAPATKASGAAIPPPPPHAPPASPPPDYVPPPAGK